MALPILEANRYTCELPITKKKVEYRAFLVKEQKHLLIAGESEDNTIINRSVVDLLQSCVYTDLNLKEIPISDVEYLFVQIRVKSVGETSDLLLSCTKCEEQNEQVIDLSKLEMNMTVPDPHIKLNETMGLYMTYPSMGDVDMDDNSSETEQVFKLMASCVESIYDGEEVYTRDDMNPKELSAFIDSMNTDQFSELNEYITNIPRLEHKVSYECKSCGTHNEVVLAGLSDFF
tara:strand:+ start:13551 stop:14246 length:696 start_codon:yes stop_codon:yes gene_type:complete